MRLLILAIPIGLVILIAREPALPEEATPTPGASHAGTGVTQSDSCFICHDDRTLMLRFESNDLCFPCHASTQAKSSKPHRHIDVTSEKYPGLGCEGCHRIHRAPGNHFLVKNELELCRACHDDAKRGKSHPVAVMAPDGRALNCASHCHDVHGTDSGFLCRLEPGRELCVSCHTEFE